MLTKQETQGLCALFSSLKNKLNKTITQEEAITIFNQVIVDLEKYELLPKSFNMQKTNDLITRICRLWTPIKFLEKIGIKNNIYTNEYSNRLCLVMGVTTNTRFESFLAAILHSFYPKILLLSLISDFNPMPMGSHTYFGNRIELYNKTDNFGYMYSPANGYIQTNGLDGLKSWDGNFYGYLGSYEYNGYFYDEIDYLGMKGFSGIHLRSFILDENIYLGFAIKIALSTNHP